MHDRGGTANNILSEQEKKMNKTEFAKLLYETKVPSSLPAEVVQKIYEPVLQYISDETPKRLYR